MQCSHPIRIPDPNNKGNFIYVRCGNCTACRIEYQTAWKIRAELEMRNHDSNLWVALTYDPVHLSLQNLEYEQDKDFSHLGRVGVYDSLEKQELDLFWKRFRKAISPLKIRYMQCGEYGGKFGRPHYHAIIFGMDRHHPIFSNFHYVKSRKGFVGYIPQWPHGEFWISENPATIENAEYLAKYIHKKHKGKQAKEYYEDLNIKPEFFSVSNRPGIGAVKIDEFSKYYQFHPYYETKGKKLSLPRYVVERVDKNIDDFKETIEFNNLEHRKLFGVRDFDGQQQERNLAHVKKG